MSAYTCFKCGGIIVDGHPYYNVHGRHVLCLDCALKLGYIGPMAWLELHGIMIYHHAEYHDGILTAYQKWGRGYRKDEMRPFDVGV